MVQRFFDIFFSGLAIIAFLPFLLPVMIILRATGEGEIFFRQERVGLHGKTFQLYKFATMLKNSPNIGTGTVTVANDPRVLPFGLILRKTKINELPQLINIFIGDMSVIGPRPQTQRCFDSFPEHCRRIIMQIRPGLSGLGSVVFRGEETLMHGHEDPEYFYDQVIMPYKGRIETWYAQNKNLWTYFLLIIITMWVVLRSKSPIVWKLMPNIPSPPTELYIVLNYAE